jgi:hypothetical protein
VRAIVRFKTSRDSGGTVIGVTVAERLRGGSRRVTRGGRWFVVVTMSTMLAIASSGIVGTTIAGAASAQQNYPRG